MSNVAIILPATVNDPQEKFGYRVKLPDIGHWQSSIIVELKFIYYSIL
jgi:hypothetical protein